MSYGGGEGGRDGESVFGDARLSGGHDLGRSISRVAVAQICESVGFHRIRCSALDALSGIAIQFVRDLGRTSHFYADLAGRTCCNVFDVLRGLEDLGWSQGFAFAGAVDMHGCLVDSGVVPEIMQYVGNAGEAPFARPVPRFPIVCGWKPAPADALVEDAPAAGKHIPGWLPAYPDPHTFVHTPVWDERRSEPRAEKIEQSRQRRKAEKSLLSLQQRLALCGAGIPVPVDDGDSRKGKRGADANSCIPTSLPFDEEEVPPVVNPAEAAAANKVSVLETFSSAVEAVKSGALDSGAGETNVLRHKRPTVRFKLGIDKKSMAAPFSFNASGAGKTGLWFFKDDEKDDKKRRAVLILKEAMENPQELVQL